MPSRKKAPQYLPGDMKERKWKYVPSAIFEERRIGGEAGKMWNWNMKTFCANRYEYPNVKRCKCNFSFSTIFNCKMGKNIDEWSSFFTVLDSVHLFRTPQGQFQTFEARDLSLQVPSQDVMEIRGGCEGRERRKVFHSTAGSTSNKTGNAYSSSKLVSNAI